MNVSSKVPGGFGEESVLDYLSRRFSYLSAAAWQQLVSEKRVACNGVLCDDTKKVKAGDLVSCQLPDFEAPAVNFDYGIIYSDDDLLAINKPPGLRVHSGGKFATANLMYHLRQLHQPPFAEIHPVNRLDADTSGLILLARNKAVLRDMMQQFAQGRVKKSYLAVVNGQPRPAAGCINLPIGAVEGAKVPRFWIDQPVGKSAVTHYRTLRRLSADYVLLELQPQTGRTHQLRVHLAAIGHPIVGDLLYTMSDDDYLAWRRNPPMPTGLQRQALHSLRLQFFHPVIKTDITLTAPIATDLEKWFCDVGIVDPCKKEPMDSF